MRQARAGVTTLSLPRLGMCPGEIILKSFLPFLFEKETAPYKLNLYADAWVTGPRG